VRLGWCDGRDEVGREEETSVETKVGGQMELNCCEEDETVLHAARNS
jgi:hypothetical protein